MSALNTIFAAHGVIQAAIALQLLLLPHATTFIIPHELDLTQVLLLRFYGAGVACIAIISLLCRDMPNMLPCKRGAAAGFLFYHMIMTLVVFQSRNDGPLPVETSWGLSAFHGIQAFVLYAWYTATAGQVKAFLKQGNEAYKQKHH
ncbi:hypothetical protein HMPREF1544_03785 [Mucor circinelloides 1006PhL]|uniref:Uncharacterized protein n=1 Tax=Mucor circinelloides f. circinelloides (strain 1006PhL) TaxID=1220926 RepID=S2JGK6_MUCC1|nr:hypothetical protein HMPREF1544_03785 [Mucor circinelloides 1006PhL]KAG1094405.1 hypothetical protein G6F42_018760 [Rhizopus arrhizus]